MNREEIVNWANDYDEYFPFWTSKERELGNKIRQTKEVSLADLCEMNDWKFKTNQPRRIANLRRIKTNKDTDVRDITKQAFLNLASDQEKIDLLDIKLEGVGTAMASVILTFYNPNDYCIFDIHLWKELFGQPDKPYKLYMTENYVKVLEKLRLEAKNYQLSVRTLEKAYFTKDYKQ